MSDDGGEMDDAEYIGRILDKHDTSLFTYLWLIRLLTIGVG